MMFYVRSPKSKAKKVPKAKLEQYEKWLESHQPTKPLKIQKTNNILSYKLSTPVGRETKQYKSLNTGEVDATKAEPKVYTGTNMLGIATMHKSNAVPVFNTEAAVEISNMRR